MCWLIEDLGAGGSTATSTASSCAPAALSLWHTTETDELDNCDRVYVFRNGRIVAELGPEDITEEKVIQSSFQEAGP